MKFQRAAALVAIFSAILLAGCSQAAPAEPKVSASPDAEGAEGAEALEPEDEPHSAKIGDRPDWAVNPVDIGKLVGEQQGDSWNVQIFRVGTAATTTDGIWELPGTDEPVIPTGTAMTVYNIVFTNTSEDEMILDEAATAAAVTLFNHGVEPFRASLMSYDPEITESFGLSKLLFDPQRLDFAPRFDDRPGLLVAPGESFALPANTLTVTADIEVTAFVNVMNDHGKPLADESELLTCTISQ